MAIRFYGPGHPKNIGAWMTLVVHKQPNALGMSSFAGEIALLRHFNLGFHWVKADRYLMVIIGWIGITLTFPGGRTYVR